MQRAGVWFVCVEGFDAARKGKLVAHETSLCALHACYNFSTARTRRIRLQRNFDRAQGEYVFSEISVSVSPLVTMWLALSFHILVKT